MPCLNWNWKLVVAWLLLLLLKINFLSTCTFDDMILWQKDRKIIENLKIVESHEIRNIHTTFFSIFTQFCDVGVTILWHLSQDFLSFHNFLSFLPHFYDFAFVQQMCRCLKLKYALLQLKITFLWNLFQITSDATHTFQCDWGRTHWCCLSHQLFIEFLIAQLVDHWERE